MIIGIPKEIMHGEGRVSATPETVKKPVSYTHLRRQPSPKSSAEKPASSKRSSDSTAAA